MKTTTMKAAIYEQYGAPEVLKVKEVVKPTPEQNEVLVKIKATAVNSGDWRLRKADPFATRFIFGLLKPKRQILGTVYSGIVESIGEAVKEFKVGDSVFGHTDMRFGAHAEYISVPENGSVTFKPANISHEEAAIVPFGGVTALHFIKKAMIKPGQKVLVAGASGAVGSAAVQLARSFGAEVTAVCSASNIAMVKSIGADKAIDYAKEDFTKNGIRYDVIMDTVNTISVSKSLKSLTANGTMILSAAGLPQMIQGAWVSMTSKRKVLTGVIKHSKQDVGFIKNLIETDRYIPVLDRTYSLNEIAAAHTYAEGGHKKGNIAVTV